jgi:hypothetical protein
MNTINGHPSSIEMTKKEFICYPPYIIENKEKNKVSTNCGNVEYKIGDIIKYKNEYGDESIGKIESFQINEDPYNYRKSYLSLKWEHGSGDRVVYIVSKDLIKQKKDTKLTKVWDFNMYFKGNIVSFEYDFEEIGIHKVPIIKIGKVTNFIDIQKNSLGFVIDGALTVIDDSKIEYTFKIKDKIITKKVLSYQFSTTEPNFGFGSGDFIAENIKPFVVKDDEQNIVYTNCGYAEYKIGDIIKFIDIYGDEYITRVEGYNINLDRKIFSYLRVRLANNETKDIHFFNGEGRIIIEEQGTELKIPELYHIGQIVDFFTPENKIIIGKVINLKIEKIGDVVQLDKSILFIEDGDRKEYQINFNNVSLKKRATNTTLSKEINLPYKEGDKVSFELKGKLVTGEVFHVFYEIKDYEIQPDKSELTISNNVVPPFFIEKIFLNNDTLIKISPDSSNGKKKYTLEDESIFRVKYAKYKVKYLIQKNNL